MDSERYRRMASQMHPKSGIPPISKTTLSGGKDGTANIELYVIAEASYTVDASFLYAPADVPLIPEDELLQETDDSDTTTIRIKAPMQFGCALAKLPNGVNVLLDGGSFGPPNPNDGTYMHPCPEPPPYPLLESLKKLGVTTPDDIHYVIYSHLHGDHIGWSKSFTKAVHVMHRREYEYATFEGCPWKIVVPYIFQPYQENDQLLLLDGEDDDGIPIDPERLPGVSLVLTKGHTSGHSAVKITTTGGTTAYYIGDALHSPLQLNQFTISHVADCCCWKIRSFLPLSDTSKTWSPSLQTETQWNATTSVLARKKLLKRIKDEHALLVSPHFPSPGMGHLHKKETSDNEPGYGITWLALEEP